MHDDTRPVTEPMPLPPLPATSAHEGAAYDLCQGALALRALAAVNTAVLVGVLAAQDDFTAALAALGPGLAASLPGTLAWLALVCLMRRALVRLAPRGRLVLLLVLGAAVALAMLAALGAIGLVAATALRALAWPLAGAVLALPLALWLQSREHQRLPSDARARLAELQARIRPHFLFNTLNTAVALVRSDPARAEGVLEDLSELFRVALGQAGASTTLGDELALARRYLEIEQLRFGARLDVQWLLDPDADDAKLPPLALQPLIENAVRHGIEPSESGGTIRVRTRARLGRAEVTIDNPLPAQGASAPGHGLALANVRERLALLHDLDASFEAGAAGGRWRVRLAVPLQGWQ